MLYLTGGIDEKAYVAVVNYLARLKGKPGIIQIHSYGGHSMDSLAIYSEIKQSKSQITTVAIGCIYSAAVLVFAAGDTRVAAKEAWFMVHEDSFNKLKGPTSLIRTEAAFGDRLERQWAELMAKETGLTAEQWDNMSRQTTYFTAEEAKELGLVHRFHKRKA